MRHDFKCQFCGSLSETYEGIYICKVCETVCFFTNSSLDEKYRRVKEYLEEIQSQVFEQQECLHQIEQKRILRATLSALEAEVCEKIAEFQSIRIELEKLIEDGSTLYSKRDRQLLYRLLMLAKWLSGYFKGDDNNSTI